MPTKPTKGAKLVSYELPTELVEELKGFAARRRERVKDVVVQALRRHMDNPPPLPAEAPLPPVPAPAPAAKKRGRPPKPKEGGP